MHHHQDHEDWQRARQWRRFEVMARRGLRGSGGIGGFGANWGGFGDNFRVGRMLASGDLRLVALYFIEEQPRHGYDLIKAIEEKTAGFYSPSPGIVYPALTYLEEAGYVTSSPEGNKKLYTITEEGRAHLADNREAVQSTLDFLGQAGEQMKRWRQMHAEHGHEEMNEPGWPFNKARRRDRDIPGVIEEVNNARRDLKRAIAEALEDGDEDTQRRLADILGKAAELIRRRDVDL
jgi:DNA-binding PadR family transcriptional regulator